MASWKALTARTAGGAGMDLMARDCIAVARIVAPSSVTASG
jgi:hypothetical protein